MKNLKVKSPELLEEIDILPAAQFEKLEEVDAIVRATFDWSEQEKQRIKSFQDKGYEQGYEKGLAAGFAYFQSQGANYMQAQSTLSANIMGIIEQAIGIILDELPPADVICQMITKALASYTDPQDLTIQTHPDEAEAIEQAIAIYKENHDNVHLNMTVKISGELEPGQCEIYAENSIVSIDKKMVLNRVIEALELEPAVLG